MGRGCVVVSALNFRSEGRWFETKSLPSCCFRNEKFYPTLSFSTQVYKMGTSNILLGVTLRWTNISSRAEKQSSQLLHATETGISSGRVGLLGSRATLSPGLNLRSVSLLRFLLKCLQYVLTVLHLRVFQRFASNARFPGAGHNLRDFSALGVSSIILFVFFFSLFLMKLVMWRTESCCSVPIKRLGCISLP